MLESMKTTPALIARLRSRLAQDRLTDGEFTQAVAEILAATDKGLSGADALVLSHAMRALDKEWRESLQRSPN